MSELIQWGIHPMLLHLARACNMKTLALDPAANCGFSHSDGRVGVWKLASETDSHPGSRVDRFFGLLSRAYAEWGFERIAYENASFGSNNLHTGAMHNELAGVIKLFTKQKNIGLLAVNPSALKKFATGNGKAKKNQMIAAAKLMLGYQGSDDNEADALWVLEFAKHPGTMIRTNAAGSSKKRKISMRRAGKVKQGKLFSAQHKRRGITPPP